MLLFCKNNNYVKFEDLRKLYEIFYEQNVPEYLNYNQFTKFIKVDDNNDNRDVFNTIIGKQELQSSPSKKKRSEEEERVI